MRIDLGLQGPQLRLHLLLAQSILLLQKLLHPVHHHIIIADKLPDLIPGGAFLHLADITLPDPQHLFFQKLQPARYGLDHDSHHHQHQQAYPHKHQPHVAVEYIDASPHSLFRNDRHQIHIGPVNATASGITGNPVQKDAAKFPVIHIPLRNGKPGQFLLHIGCQQGAVRRLQIQCLFLMGILQHIVQIFLFHHNSQDSHSLAVVIRIPQLPGNGRIRTALPASVQKHPHRPPVVLPEAPIPLGPIGIRQRMIPVALGIDY